MYNLYPNR
jgi:hypothetical protein